MIKLRQYYKVLGSPPFQLLDRYIFWISRRNYNYEVLLHKFFLKIRKMKKTSEIPIILIGGCTRSGTTLARALIGMHPKIACPQKECLIYNIKTPHFLESTFDFSTEEINHLKTKFNEDNLTFAERVISLYLKKSNKEFIALKAPLYVTVVNELFKIFPNMKFIHMIRDGRDVACSLKTYPNKEVIGDKIYQINSRNPLSWCIRKWITFMAAGIKQRGSKGYIEIKYEDLVNSPVETMKNLFEFLELDMPSKDQLLSYYKYEIDIKHPQNIEIGKPIYNKAIERWKRDMSKSEKAYFKRVAGSLLIKTGYEKDFNW